METISIELLFSESERQMFGQLFTSCDSDNTGIVPQSVAKQLLTSAQLDAKVLDQIIELSASSRLTSLSRKQFYAMLRLVACAQSGLPLSTEALSTNTFAVPLPQLSPIVDSNKAQIMANNVDDNNKSETMNHQMTGHLPPPPTKPSVRSNRRNNQFSNSDNLSQPPIESINNYNSLNINSSNNNNNNNNHIQCEQNELTNSRSSSANELNDSPIDPIVDKSYDYRDNRDKTWSEFNDKTKDKPINWADFDEEHHLLGNEDEDEEEEDNKSNVSSDEDSFDIWSVSEEQRVYYTNQFKAMQTDLKGIITGNKAKDFFEKSCLPIQELSQIWQLSDIDKDGALNLNEFCIAMHLVVLRRNCVELPAQLPKTLMPSMSPNDANRVPSLNNSTNCIDLVTDSITTSMTTCIDQHYSPLSPQPNDLNDLKVKSAETLSPQNKEWTKFTDSPTNQIVVTAVSPPSTSSSAGRPVQPLANFDFSAASIVRDPKILHPVALRLSPDGQQIRYDTNETNNHSLHTSCHSVNNSDPIRSSNAVIQGKKDPPPPPPPRPYRNHGHTRSSSLDLNKIIVRSSAGNDLIPSQIPLQIKVSNSDYGLTATQKELPALSLDPKNLGAFHAYKRTKAETSLTNTDCEHSWIEALKCKYRVPAEVPAPKNSNNSTELWQTIRCFQEYTKVLVNMNNDLLRELIRVTEDNHCLESRLAQLNIGCKL